VLTRVLEEAILWKLTAIQVSASGTTFKVYFYLLYGYTWRLQNFKYDDSIDEELEEAIKAYRLKENLDY
jgi:hypothetical protein